MRSVFCLVAAAVACLAAASPEEVFRAIRDGDEAALKRLIADGVANKPDAKGTTPLHYAAVYGSDASVRLLLEAGADVKARNVAGATPLILGAYSPSKAKLLLAKGADVKARSKGGRTAMHVAAGRAGGAGTLRLLLDAGASVDEGDERGQTALQQAAMAGDLEAVQLLVARGANVNLADKAGYTPLALAASVNEPDIMRLLLAKGADPNVANQFAGEVRKGKIALVNMPPLLYAAPFGSPETVRMLLEAGAKVNVQDGRGMTPLMAAAASERQDTAVMDLLLKAGANVNAKDGVGDSVLDWARKVGNPVSLKRLEAAGAKGQGPAAMPSRPASLAPWTAKESVERAMAKVRGSQPQFFNEGGCVGCHHQPSAALADAAIRAAGLSSDDAVRKSVAASMTAMRPVEPALLQFVEIGGGADTAASIALAAHHAAMPASTFTDALVHYVAAKQRADGSWPAFGISRPPSEDSDITRTATIVRAIRAYGWPARQKEFDERVARARAWLLKAEPATSYEKADRLLGLHDAGAGPEELERAAAALLADQRADGGWAQNRHLATDAYATGLALYALNQSGRRKASDAAYRRGVDYLLRTQLEDGTWYVRSRAPKFQPYFQSGFPHDHDQWISVMATSYAVAALAPAAGMLKL
ncbi:MAG: ankyrin repeat domain-containing protein [Bryobacteraceae bacterium]|nr:ankyrin repeat domain-containing protein [Bryobacteraceae bacterium]